MGLFSETLCSFLLEAEVGESVTIWCQHGQTRTNSIFWFKHTTDSVPLLVGCKKFRTSAPSQSCYFFNNTERLVMSVQPENTSLTITALNISDTGLYYCSSMESNILTFRNWTYLHVKGVNKTQGYSCSSVIFMLNTVFGSVVVILLGVLIFILLKHRNTHGGGKADKLLSSQYRLCRKDAKLNGARKACCNTSVTLPIELTPLRTLDVYE
ncbi:putative immune-type receptor 11b precursor [Silurus asotus]|uniref:Immune-type receptor 11b n=1 Tax=Silurus asotus TaxID=30991 RepID=A0AAD5B9I7_SILAS|nr:putative immune-type receptor 11b precursor [Silurus asotus]